MFEIEKVDMEHIDRIRPLWEKLIQANAANSPYFADYYGTFEFEIRKGFLQEKLDNGAAMYTAVLVDREKKQDAGFVTVTYNRDTSWRSTGVRAWGRSCSRWLFPVWTSTASGIGNSV